MKLSNYSILFFYSSKLPCYHFWLNVSAATIIVSSSSSELFILSSCRDFHYKSAAIYSVLTSSSIAYLRSCYIFGFKAKIHLSVVLHLLSQVFLCSLSNNRSLESRGTGCCLLIGWCFLCKPTQIPEISGRHSEKKKTESRKLGGFGHE